MADCFLALASIRNVALSTCDRSENQSSRSGHRRIARSYRGGKEAVLWPTRSSRRWPRNGARSMKLRLPTNRSPVTGRSLKHLVKLPLLTTKYICVPRNCDASSTRVSLWIDIGGHQRGPRIERFSIGLAAQEIRSAHNSSSRTDGGIRRSRDRLRLPDRRSENRPRTHFHCSWLRVPPSGRGFTFR